MGLFDLLFGSRRKEVGRIYSMYSVEDEYRDKTEIAISEEQYDIFASNPDGRAILILRTEPPLVAIITREPSFSGGAPDIIVKAVYEGGDDPHETAAELAGLA